MKGQWNLILALIFALLVAIFAVINVEPVEVHYVFGTAQLPLILVILGSSLMGGIIVGSVGLFRMFMLQRKLKGATKENQKNSSEMEELKKKLENQDSNKEVVDTVSISEATSSVSKPTEEDNVLPK